MLPFLKVGKQKKNEKPKLVHLDVWVPIDVSSFGGSQYYVTFIDDATKKVWTYFMACKSDAFNVF